MQRCPEKVSSQDAAGRHGFQRLLISPKALKYGLIAVLFVCTVVNVVSCLKYKPPIDLISLYTAGQMFRAQEDPYDDDALKKKWQEIAAAQNIRVEDQECAPGLPSALLYPPNAILLYSFISIVPWSVLPLLMRILFALLLLAMVFVLWKTRFGREYVWLFILLLAVVGINAAPWLLIGINSTVLVLFFIALFYRAMKNGRDALAGLFLAAASLKVTLVIPFFVFVLLRRKWKIAGFFLVFGAAPFLYMLLTDATYTVVLTKSWLRSIGEWERILYSIYPESGFWHGFAIWYWHKMLDYVTAIGPIVSFYSRVIFGMSSYAAVKVIVFIGAALMFLAVFMIDRKKRLADEPMIVMLLCIELLANYHLQYDALLPMLFLMMISPVYPRKLLVPLVIAASFYYLPYNGLLIRLGVPKQLYLWAFNIALPMFVIFVSIGYGALRGNAVNKRNDSGHTNETPQGVRCS